MENKTIEKYLLYLFYVLVVATICIYFFAEEVDKTYFYYTGGAALTVRGMHYIIKYLM